MKLTTPWKKVDCRFPSGSLSHLYKANCGPIEIECLKTHEGWRAYLSCNDRGIDPSFSSGPARKELADSQKDGERMARDFMRDVVECSRMIGDKYSRLLGDMG